MYLAARYGRESICTHYRVWLQLDAGASDACLLCATCRQIDFTSLDPIPSLVDRLKNERFNELHLCHCSTCTGGSIGRNFVATRRKPATQPASSDHDDDAADDDGLMPAN